MLFDHEKELERVVKDGWKIQIQIEMDDNELNYYIFACNHEVNNCTAIVGEGNTFSKMLDDFKDCEEELIGKSN